MKKIALTIYEPGLLTLKPICIHGAESYCRKCDRAKEGLIWKESNPAYIQKYNDGVFVPWRAKLHLNIGLTKPDQLDLF